MFITFLAVVSPVKVGVFQFLPGLMFLWIFFIIYKGVNRKRNLVYISQQTNGYDKRFLVLLAIAHLLFYPSYSQFYSGISILTGVYNFLSGTSSYVLYQEYFENNDLALFSLDKVPYILGNGILHFLFVSATIKIIGFRPRLDLVEFLCLIIMSVVILLSSFSRGTSFEIFEVVIIWVFAIIVRNHTKSTPGIWTLKQKIVLFAIFVLIVFFFYVNIQLRFGNDVEFAMDTSFNNHSFVFAHFPSIAQIMYVLFDYFAFGIHYTSVLSNHFWFSTQEGFMSFMLPDRFLLTNAAGYDYRDIVGKIINLGARWNPDFTILTEGVGFPLTLIIIGYLGRTTYRVAHDTNYGVIHAVTVYYSFYIMFAFPVGNFITTSSANLISVVLSLFVLRVWRAYPNVFRFYVVQSTRR